MESTLLPSIPKAKAHLRFSAPNVAWSNRPCLEESCQDLRDATMRHKKLS